VPAIRKLPPELVREIAAGEVVTAPVDVLKELVENALDAGATRLEVTLEGGGIRRIAVRDNGEGIPAAELPLAAEAHSSSKLASLQDIRTLGFRGEGLYAIRHAGRLSSRAAPRAARRGDAGRAGDAV
jgi:DNA mismatch repair protein MutL